MPEKKQDVEQIERFKQTARELGCDEDEAAFDEKLKALAKQTARYVVPKRQRRPDDAE